MNAKVLKAEEQVFAKRQDRVAVARPGLFARWFSKMAEHDGRALEYLEWAGGL